MRIRQKGKFTTAVTAVRVAALVVSTRTVTTDCTRQDAHGEAYGLTLQSGLSCDDTDSAILQLYPLVG